MNTHKSLHHPQKLRIISRNSPLAMWQAEYVAVQLRNRYPEMHVQIIGIVTQGDKILDRSLDKIGGKGLFIKELEQGLLNDVADIAVHSLKDVSANIDPDFQIMAVFNREDPCDIFIANAKYQCKTLDELPKGSVIGTSSARRIAILHKYYPQLQVKLLRGNLHTRFSKLDTTNEYAGIILANSGVKRLGLEARVTEKLSIETFIPAIGQGALAIEFLSSRSRVLQELLAPFKHMDTVVAVTCEREVGRLLNADCSTPIAAHATIVSENQISIRAMLASTDLSVYKYATAIAGRQDYLNAAKQCAMQLK